MKLLQILSSEPVLSNMQSLGLALIVTLVLVITIVFASKNHDNFVGGMI